MRASRVFLRLARAATDPHLERDETKPDLLSAIGKPLVPVGVK